MTRTVIGLVYHSGSKDLARCLKSLPPAPSQQIVVLDASGDGSARHVLADRADTEWIDGSRNGGYAWGLSRIAQDWLTPGDVFVAANADVRLLPNTLTRLVAHATTLEGIYYPLQFDETGSAAPYNLHGQLSLWESIARWWGVGRRGRRRRIDRTILEASSSQKAVRVPRGLCGSGAMLVMSQRVWERSGGLDPQFFLFYEDISLGSTADGLGIAAYLCGDAQVVHEGGFRGRGVTAFGTTEALVSEQLHWKKIMKSPTAVVVVIQTLGLVVRVLSCTLRGSTTARRAYWIALRYRLRHLSTMSAAPTSADGFRTPALSSFKST